MEELKPYDMQLPDTLNYPPGLAIEVAVIELVSANEDIDVSKEIEAQLKQFDITQEQYEKIKNNPNFRSDVVAHKQSLKSDGGTIKRKAEIMFDFYLSEYIPEAMKDEKVTPNDKFKLLELLGKVSGRYNQKSDVVQAVESMAKASQPSIVINLPPQAEMPKIAERVS